MLIAEIALGAKEFSKVEIPGDGLGSQNQIVLGGWVGKVLGFSHYGKLK